LSPPLTPKETVGENDRLDEHGGAYGGAGPEFMPPKIDTAHRCVFAMLTGACTGHFHDADGTAEVIKKDLLQGCNTRLLRGSQIQQLRIQFFTQQGATTMNVFQDQVFGCPRLPCFSCRSFAASEKRASKIKVARIKLR